MQGRRQYTQALKWLLPAVGMTTLGCVQTQQGSDRPLVVQPSFAAGTAKPGPMPVVFNMPEHDWLGALAVPDQSLLTMTLRKPARNHPPVAHSYEANGRHHDVYTSSKGYVRQGLASWYGKSFHGKATASGETYDMHGLSAAHRSLPLDSCLLVINKENNRRVVVKVNDRGPFSQPFFLDLSYEAARRLKMVSQGKALVEARAIGQHTCQLLAKRMQQHGKSKTTRLTSRQQATDNPMHMVQVGTFREHHRASELLETIRALGYSGFIRPDRGVDASTVYRIILGMPDTHGTMQPLSLAQQLIAAAAQLSRYQ